jgi:hypothetical protein
MRTPQLKPDWETGIYIGNGRIAKPKSQTNTWYTMWFKDGGGRKMFMDKDVEDYAKRFDFDAKELRSQGEVDFIDEFGDIVGGVTLDL